MEDLRHVCAHMRPADRQECMAFTGLPPEATLPSAVAQGALAMVVPETGEVIGLCGVDKCSLADFGLIWMCATTALSDHRHAFLRHAKALISAAHIHFPRIGNMVDARNTLHVRWLALLGFQFTGAALLGPLNVPFLTFERSRTDPCVNP